MLRPAIIASVMLFLPAFAKSQVAILIQNPSFEHSQVLENSDPCGLWTTAAPIGWTVTRLQPGAGVGVLQPANPSPASNPNCYGGISQPPDGMRVAYLAGASISQDLGAVSGTGVYTLKFFVGNRFYYYPALYSASLTLTDGEGAHAYSVSGYAMGDFIEIPLICIRENPKQADLSISFTGDGHFMLLLDKVSLSFTPTN